MFSVERRFDVADRDVADRDVADRDVAAMQQRLIFYTCRCCDF